MSAGIEIKGGRICVPSKALLQAGELVLPGQRAIIDLDQENPQLYDVEYGGENVPEVGKYIVTGKWGKRVSVRPIDPSELSRWRAGSIIKAGRVALESLPEPYGSRLAALLVILSLSA
jgi:hypothetical protein